MKLPDKKSKRPDGIRFDTEMLLTPMSQLIKSAIHMGQKQAEPLVKNQAEQLFNQQYGSEQPLMIEQEEARRAKDDSLKNLKSAEKVETDEPKFKKALPDMEDGNYQRIPFKQWRFQDQALVSILLPLMLMMMGTSAVNIFVNIMAVPSPVFLDAEWKAWLLSFLAPAGSVVIKMLPQAFERQSHQELAKRALITLTVLLIIYWIWSFNLRFDGLGGQPDFGDLLISDADNAGQDTFVFVQVLVEMMIAANIFTWLQNLFDTYLPNKLIPNPDHSLAVERLEQATQRHQAALERLQASEEALSAYNSAKQAFINDQSAALALAYARFNSLYS